MTLSRRKFLARLAFYGTPVAGFSYGSLIEKNYLDVNEVKLPLPTRHSHLAGTKVAVMADFHHDDFGSNRLIGRAVERINAEKIDAVILAGDFISHDTGAMEPLCNELSALQTKYGVFAVLGNHDCWNFDEAIPRLFNEAGVNLLLNGAVDCGEFAVVGLDSHWGGRPDRKFAARSLDTEKPIIYGWHEPDTFAMWEEPQVVLQVSGHTHGGQICAPFKGPLLLPKYGKKYPFGHFQKPGSNLYVTRGIGTLNIPARFLCPPELAILTLVSRKAG